MSIKTTTFIRAHYPYTFMEQFCHSIHPDLELGPVCVNWFRQATKHCNALIVNAKAPSMFFWTTVKNFIFPEIHTELMSPKVPIRIHPNRLTMQDCQALFLDIVNDYVLRAPRYAAESTTNVMLWQVLYSVLGIMASGSLLLAVILTYSKYRKGHGKHEQVERIFTPDERLHAAARRSLNMAKREVSQLQVEPIVQPEELLAPDGTAVLAIKICSKQELFDGLVSSTVLTAARFCRNSREIEQSVSEFKTEAVNKALRFLGSNATKLRLLLIFDDVPFSEDKVEEKPKDRPVRTTTPKSSQIPNKLKRFSMVKHCNVKDSKRTSCVESIVSGSPRLSSTLSYRSSDIVGDVDTPRSRLGPKKKSLDAPSESPPTGSPKKRITTPRHGNAEMNKLSRLCPKHHQSVEVKPST